MITLLSENYAGNIIVNLASLPDFLRKPILKKRLLEFFSLEENEKQEIIQNALEAGPTIPFPNFARIFKTWLEILATLEIEKRKGIFEKYFLHIINHPHSIIKFNLDALLEIFFTLKKPDQALIAKTITDLISNFSDEQRKKIMLLMPENAKKTLKV